MAVNMSVRPGSKAQAIIARDDTIMSGSMVPRYPFVIERGLGARVWDVDGNDYIDFAAGIAVNATGHCHPEVVKAIQDQAAKFIHIAGTDYYYEVQIQLAERLASIAPFSDPARVFFCNSGTESVEGALKLARYVTGRSRFIGFLGGFHGRTMGSLAFTSSKYTQQQGFFPTMPGVTHVPYPNNYRPIFAGADQGQAVLDYIENVLFQHNVPAKEVAGILIEPMQGEGGYIVPPDGFLVGLRALCDRHGIMLIFDEVQTGIGRTGKMFAAHHTGVIPDIMTLAKGLGSGMPIGLVVAKKKHMEQWKRGAHGNTYGGNPVCCAAALATLDLVEREYMANAATVGAYFMERLREWQTREPSIGEVRGQGLFIGMELVAGAGDKTPARKLCDDLVTRAYHNGLILLSCGVSTLRFMPPLLITRADVDEAMVILEASLAEARA